MTQKEFKEILESIEVGLYDKWEKNVKADKDNEGENILESIERTCLTRLISCKFIWNETDESTQGQIYWYNIEQKYQEILKERGYETNTRTKRIKRRVDSR